MSKHLGGMRHGRTVFGFRPAAVLIAVAMVVCATGCAQKGRAAAIPQEARLSPTFRPLAHFEDGQVAFVAVDGRAAQFVRDGKFVPLGFAIANRSKGTLTVLRESLVLEDAAGRRYPAVSYPEFLEGYSRARTDARLADVFEEAVRLRFPTYTATPLSFFPLNASRTGSRERVELDRTAYAIGYLYFPMPADGIHGKAFTLLIGLREFPDRLVVKFGIL